MTFVNKKTRVFYDRGDLKPERRRSESRLKKYVSSSDLRAWCDAVEDRRQHILELTTKDYGKCRESLIPLNSIVNAVLSRKNADTQDVQKCLNKMWSFIESVSLNEQDRTNLSKMKKEMSKTCIPSKDLDNSTDKNRKSDSKKDSKAKPSKIAAESSKQPTEDSEDQILKSTTYSGNYTVKSTKYKYKAAGPATVKMKIRGIEEGFTLSDGPIDQKDKTQKVLVKNAYPKTDRQKAIDPANGSDYDTKESPSKPPKGRRDKRSTAPAPTRNSIPKSPKDIIYKKEDQTKSQNQNSTLLTDSQITEDKPISKVKEDLGNQVIHLQDQLAAREALCKEQRTNIENLKNERDKLKKRIEVCLKELESLRNLNKVANPDLPSSCKEEIDALEHEIRVMRSGNASPEEEAAMIQKEVEMLRRYCMKLKSDENDKPKTATREGKGEVSQQRGGVDPAVLETVIAERDSLERKLKDMEQKLAQMPFSPDDENVYKDKAEMLDNVLAERDELRAALGNLKELEKENERLRLNIGDQQKQKQQPRTRTDITDLELRKTQSKCGCLENEIQNLRKEKEVMANRIVVMKSEIDTLRPKAREAEMLKLERDKLQIKLNELSHVQVHNENLMLKCRCLENALTEKDNYRQKYEDILSMECQCDLMRNQADENKSLIRDKESMKKQIEDLNTCIHEQEEEIKKLMANIDELMQTKQDSHVRMKEALATMRSEVAKKDSLIATSEERLAAVQTQLKSSIQGVSCETICNKTRIEDLERELAQSQRTVKALQKQLKDKMTPSDNVDLFENMKNELAQAREENRKLQEIAKKMAIVTGDEHVQKMLKQSECAVRKVVEELGKQYKEWDIMKKHQGCVLSDEHIYATRQDLAASDEQEIKIELDDIRKEKQKLEKIVADIQSQKYAKSCQKIMEYLKTENAKLREELQKETNLRKKLELGTKY